jgi:hypothetical protein
MNWLRALAERRRIRRIARRYDAIVEVLGHRESRPLDLASKLGWSVPETDHWLRLAEASGVVVSCRFGASRLYRVRPVDA